MHPSLPPAKHAAPPLPQPAGVSSTRPHSGSRRSVHACKQAPGIAADATHACSAWGGVLSHATTARPAPHTEQHLSMPPHPGTPTKPRPHLRHSHTDRRTANSQPITSSHKTIICHQTPPSRARTKRNRNRNRKTQSQPQLPPANARLLASTKHCRHPYPCPPEQSSDTRHLRLTGSYRTRTHPALTPAATSRERTDQLPCNARSSAFHATAVRNHQSLQRKLDPQHA
jgi:hypothetical protein